MFFISYIQTLLSITSPLVGEVDAFFAAGEGCFLKNDGMSLMKFQKKLRREATDAEQYIWYFLKNRSLHGGKFRRQHILQGYIVDFVCLEKKLVIELDGGQHAENQRDVLRTEKLERDGFRVIRFWNHEIFTNTHGVLESICDALKNTPHPPQKTRRPLPQGER